MLFPGLNSSVNDINLSPTCSLEEHQTLRLQSNTNSRLLKTNSIISAFWVGVKMGEPALVTAGTIPWYNVCWDLVICNNKKEVSPQ